MNIAARLLPDAEVARFVYENEGNSARTFVLHQRRWLCSSRENFSAASCSARRSNSVVTCIVSNCARHPDLATAHMASCHCERVIVGGCGWIEPWINKP